MHWISACVAVELRVMLVELLLGSRIATTRRQVRKKKRFGNGLRSRSDPGIRSVPLRLSSEKKGLSVEPRFVAGAP